MDKNDPGMKTYYRDRAPVYDRIYGYPERQEDLRFMEEHIPTQLAGLDVIEVAAGTGYWSQFIIHKAASLLATDVNRETLHELHKRLLVKPISTQVIDAWLLHNITSKYNGAFAGMWISHIPKQKMEEFLSSLHRCLRSGATVVFMDNSPAQIARLPMLPEADEFGNTYQDRKLDDGSIYRILKNFPVEEELVEMTSDFGSDHRYLALDHFWLFQYRAR